MLVKWLPLPQNLCPSLRRHSRHNLHHPYRVDVSVLKTLVGDDVAVVREFLHDFRASSTTIAAELRAACQRGEATATGAAAHKLKSSARSVGALTLGDLCAEMEQAGMAGDNEMLAAHCPDSSKNWSPWKRVWIRCCRSGLRPRKDKEMIMVEKSQSRSWCLMTSRSCSSCLAGCWKISDSPK